MKIIRLYKLLTYSSEYRNVWLYQRLAVTSLKASRSTWGKTRPLTFTSRKSFEMKKKYLKENWSKDNKGTLKTYTDLKTKKLQWNIIFFVWN